jgi:hypothetical protein
MSLDDPFMRFLHYPSRFGIALALFADLIVCCSIITGIEMTVTMSLVV